MRKCARADQFKPFVAYAAARPGEGPHVQASMLCDELDDLGKMHERQVISLHEEIYQTIEAWQPADASEAIERNIADTAEYLE